MFLLRRKLYYCTKYQNPELSASYVKLTPEVRTVAMLILLMVGNWNVRRQGGMWWQDIHTKLHENPSVGPSECYEWDRHADRWTHMHTGAKRDDNVRLNLLVT